MTKDLEDTLEELGPGYREVVDRLLAAYRAGDAAHARPADNPASRRSGLLSGWGAGLLAAASLALFIGVAAWLEALRPVSPAAFAAVPKSARAYTAAYAADEAALAAIVGSQRPDGSWENDFITCQNAAALRSAGDATGRMAYKKAVRYLRQKGLKPLSGIELRDRGNYAARVLSRG